MTGQSAGTERQKKVPEHGGEKRTVGIKGARGGGDKDGAGERGRRLM